jgi:hypothetical protein
MTVKIDYDPSLMDFERILIAVGRQFPFATARALNDTAVEFQKQQRAWQEQIYEIREKQFFRFSVKINNADRATPKRMTAIVHIDDRVRRTKGFGTLRRPDIWDRLQFDRTRLPKSGNQKLAIPSEEVDRTTRGLIRKKDYPNQLRKRKRSFTVPFDSGASGVFERIGRRQKAFVKGTEGKRLGLREDPNVRFLYYLAPKASLSPAFNFYENAVRVWKVTFDGRFRVRLADAFANIKIPKG